MKRPPLVFVYALAAVLSSCSWLQPQPKITRETEDKKNVPAPQYLGTVQQVYPTQKFALLRIIGPIPAPGATVITHPEDGSTSRMGNLVVAKDAAPRGNILAADIRSGDVVSGDRVFLYRNIAAPDPSAPKKNADPAAPQPPAAPKPPVSLAPLLPAPTTPLQEPDAPQQLPTPAAADAPEAAAPAQPASTLPQPGVPPTPTQFPGYLNDIPNDISAWN